MPAVLERQAIDIVSAVVVRVGIVVIVVDHIDAVNVHTGRGGVDTAGILVVNIHVVNAEAHGIAGDHRAVRQVQLLAAKIGQDSVGIRSIGIVHIRAIDKLEVVKVNGAGSALAHLDAVNEHQAEGHTGKNGIRRLAIQLRLAVFPALPPNAGILVRPIGRVITKVLGLEGEFILLSAAGGILIVAAKPQAGGGSLTAPFDARSLRSVHPHADGAGRAGDLELLRRTDQRTLGDCAAVSEVVVQLQGMGAHPHGFIVVNADDLSGLDAAIAVVGRGQQADLVAVLVLLVDGIILLGRDHHRLAGGLIHGGDVFKVPHDRGQLADHHGHGGGDGRVRHIGGGNGAVDAEAVVGGVRSVRIKDAHALIRLAPAEIRGGIAHADIAVLRRQAQLAGLGEAEAHLVGREGYAVRVDQLNAGGSHDLVFVNQLHGQGAGGRPAAGEKTGGCVNAAQLRRAFAQPPGDVFRHGNRRTGAVGTHSAELNGGAGRIKVAAGGKNGVVKYAGGLCLGNHHQGAKGRSFHTVRGGVLDLQLAGTRSLGDEGGGAAAVAVHGRHTAEINHGLCQLIAGHAHGIRRLAAIHNEQNDISVRLDADSGSRCAGTGGVVGGAVEVHAVLHKDLEGRSGLPLVAAKRFPAAADLSLSVLGQNEISLGRSLVINGAIDDKHTDRLIAFPGKVRVDGAHNVDAKHPLGGFCLLGGDLGLPHLRIHVAIAGKKVHIGVAQVNLHHMAHILVVARSIVEIQGLFLNAGSDRMVSAQSHRVVCVTAADPGIGVHAVFLRSFGSRSGVFTCCLPIRELLFALNPVRGRLVCCECRHREQVQKQHQAKKQCCYTACLHFLHAHSSFVCICRFVVPMVCGISPHVPSLSGIAVSLPSVRCVSHHVYYNLRVRLRDLICGFFSQSFSGPPALRARLRQNAVLSDASGQHIEFHAVEIMTVAFIGLLGVHQDRMHLAPALLLRGDAHIIAIQRGKQPVIVRRNRKGPVLKGEALRFREPAAGIDPLFIAGGRPEKRVDHI